MHATGRPLEYEVATLPPGRPPAPRQHEVLRSCGALFGDAARLAEEARREVLTWAQERCGSALPQAAWTGTPFQHMPGGRMVLGTAFEANGIRFWGLRADEPDGAVPDSVWTTELLITHTAAGRIASVGLRSLLATPQDQPRIEPRVPTVFRRLARAHGLAFGGCVTQPLPFRETSEAGAQRLVTMLTTSALALPVIVLAEDAPPPLDAAALAEEMFGLAHVLALPAVLRSASNAAPGLTWHVPARGLRVFMPGMQPSDRPERHPFRPADAVRADPAGCLRWLRVLLGRESLRRWPLGRGVEAFATLHSIARGKEREAARLAGAGPAEQLEAAQRWTEALEAELTGVRQQVDDLAAEAERERRRADEAEHRLAWARERLRQLAAPAPGEALPDRWDGFAEWCERALAPRLVLASLARRNLRAPAFHNPGLVARCLLWLAGPYRDARLHGGMEHSALPPGVENSRCGSDSFTFDFEERKLAAEWHLKTLASTRKPERCLRIYYAWDPRAGQVVVGDLPAHRPSRLS